LRKEIAKDQKMGDKRAANMLVKHRDGCARRLQEIADERERLNREENIVIEKIEMLNKTISLFMKENDLISEKASGKKTLISKKGVKYTPNDKLDIPLEAFASLNNPSWSASVCQDVRAIVQLHDGPITTEAILEALESQSSYATASTFKKTLQNILKAAREAKGCWLAYTKQGYTYAYTFAARKRA
jgi:hypothetical protein